MIGTREKRVALVSRSPLSRRIIRTVEAGGVASLVEGFHFITSA